MKLLLHLLILLPVLAVVLGSWRAGGAPMDITTFIDSECASLLGIEFDVEPGACASFSSAVASLQFGANTCKIETFSDGNCEHSVFSAAHPTTTECVTSGDQIFSTKWSAEPCDF